MENPKKIAVIGAGAAGYFASISAAQHHPNARVELFEKTDKVLGKVKISGGGRCNVMHHCFDIDTLLGAYPRGGKKLKGIFYQFGPQQTHDWFEQNGVTLKTEKDGRMFPSSNSSQTIVDVLMNTAQNAGVVLHKQSHVTQLLPNGDHAWQIRFATQATMTVDYVIVTTGGSPKKKGLDWLAQLDHKIVPPVPSLFTFNMPNEIITALKGVVAPHAQVQIVGTKIATQGPLLVTHWGMSGPAILKASSLGARWLAEQDYTFTIRVRWNDRYNHNAWLNLLQESAKKHAQKQLGNHNPSELPQRLWIYLLERMGLPTHRRWSELGQKNIHRLIDVLTNDTYAVLGKTTFKEEFVTCGGVALNNIDLQSMRSKIHPRLYFAGEVLDIDAITGGYNFQAAWSSGFVAGKLQ